MASFFHGSPNTRLGAMRTSDTQRWLARQPPDQEGQTPSIFSSLEKKYIFFSTGYSSLICPAPQGCEKVPAFLPRGLGGLGVSQEKRIHIQLNTAQ